MAIYLDGDVTAVN